MPIADVGEAYRYWLDLWKSGHSWPRTGVLILSCGLQPAASPQGRMFRGLRGSEEPLFHGPRNPIHAHACALPCNSFPVDLRGAAGRRPSWTTFVEELGGRAAIHGRVSHLLALTRWSACLQFSSSQTSSMSRSVPARQPQYPRRLHDLLCPLLTSATRSG